MARGQVAEETERVAGVVGAIIGVRINAGVREQQAPLDSRGEVVARLEVGDKALGGVEGVAVLGDARGIGGIVEIGVGVASRGAELGGGVRRESERAAVRVVTVPIVEGENA